MTRALTPPTPSPSTRVLAQIETYGLTTLRAAVRLLRDGDGGRAHRVLGGLVERELAFAHRDGPAFVYYTTERRPLHPRELRTAFGTLAFATYTRQGRGVLPRPQFATIAAKIAQIAGIPAVPFRPCYKLRVRNGEPERLSLLRVGMTENLQRAVDELDQFVSSSAFRPWYYLVLSDGFALTYLLPAAEPAVNELARWVRRRPVLSRVGSKPVQVPVYVFEAKRPA